MHDIILLHVLRRNLLQDVEMPEGDVRWEESRRGVLLGGDVEAVKCGVGVLAVEVEEPDSFFTVVSFALWEDMFVVVWRVKGIPSTGPYIGYGNVAVAAGVGKSDGWVQEVSDVFFPDVVLEVEACRGDDVAAETVRVCGAHVFLLCRI